MENNFNYKHFASEDKINVLRPFILARQPILLCGLCATTQSYTPIDGRMTQSMFLQDR